MSRRRAEVWNRTLEGKYEIILGARSSVFLPLSNPGLIIIDEEHDYSYKQADPAPRYSARDAAALPCTHTGSFCPAWLSNTRLLKVISMPNMKSTHWLSFPRGMAT